MESCPGAQTFEQVMEWLIAHEDELNNEVPSDNGSTSKVAKVETGAGSGEDASSNNKTNQQGGSQETAVNMAARKKITVEEAQRIITERQAKRAEEERKKEIEDEKRRRVDGQKMAETRAELQDQERIRLAQQIRREKLEKELHRKQVLEQIARDREAMRQKSNPKPSNSTPTSSIDTPSSLTKTPSKGPSTECKIALRFPDGSSLMQKFSPHEQLAAVRLFVQMEKSTANSVEFVAPPNKKLTESMMNDTLESLGLCPASRLEVKYKQANWSDMD